MTTKRIALLLPCFNEVASLPRLRERVEAAAVDWPYDWKAILVDDGSDDGTWQHIEAFAAGSAHWVGQRLSRNFGHQTALSVALEHASWADGVAILDADLQDPPEMLGAMFAKWEAGHEVVYAVRRRRTGNPFLKLSYWAFYRLLARLASLEIPLDSGDFCVLDRRVVAVINAMPERTRFLRGMRAWAGFRQTSIAYDRDSRQAGESKYSFRKLLQLATDGLLSFSGAPLRLASFMGFLFAGISFLGAIFTFLQRMFSDAFESVGLGPVPGFATIVISILFLGSVQLICLGIIGEYIIRIFEEVKGRPRGILAERSGVLPEAHEDPTAPGR